MEARTPEPVRMRLATDDEALDGTVHCWSPYSFKSRYRCYNVQVTSKLNKRPLHVTSSEFICIGWGGGGAVCVSFPFHLFLSLVGVSLWVGSIHRPGPTIICFDGRQQ